MLTPLHGNIMLSEKFDPKDKEIIKVKTIAGSESFAVVSIYLSYDSFGVVSLIESQVRSFLQGNRLGLDIEENIFRGAAFGFVLNSMLMKLEGQLVE